MSLSTPISEQIGRYLDLAAAQLKVTADNMANIDTPGYRALGFDFEAEMQRAMTTAGTSSSPNGGTQAVAGGSLQPSLTEVDGLLERPDGNNVSMDREGLALAEAQLKFRTGVELIKQEYTRLMNAIHVDGK